MSWNIKTPGDYINGPLTVAGSATITGDLTVRTTGLTVNSSGVGVGVTASLGAGNIQIGAGKYLGYSATAYMTPEDNVQGARIKANNILVDATNESKFNIGGTLAMTLNSTGNLVFPTGKGIDFAATASGSGTMTSELLNDYEEGTFTPGITFGGGNTGLTGSVFAGRYTKVGRTVTICGLIVLTNKGSSTGGALITGLPFANSNTPGGYVSVSLRLSAITFTNVFQGYIGPNQTYINLDQITVLGVQSALSNSNFSNSSELIWNATYDV
jgi:hypothetical protein